MVSQSEIQEYVGKEICLKIVQNDTLLGQISGILAKMMGSYVVIWHKTPETTFFFVDLTRLVMNEGYWMVDLGYNPSNIG